LDAVVVLRYRQAAVFLKRHRLHIAAAGGIERPFSGEITIRIGSSY
jgi:hypothetical protein